MTEPDNAVEQGGHGPFDRVLGGRRRCARRQGDLVNRVVWGSQPKLGRAVDDDRAAHPDHRRRPDKQEKPHEHGHAAHDPDADLARQRQPPLACHQEAEIVGLHDEPDGAIDRKRDQRPRDGKRRSDHPDRLVLRERRQDDRHDLGRQDQVGPDGAADLLLLEMRSRQLLPVEVLLVTVGRVHDVPDLLRPFEAEIGAAQHQDRRDRPRGERREQQGRRQQDDDLVEQRPFGDLPDDGNLAAGRKAVRVFRRHGGVVDDGSGRLGGCLDRLPEDVVNGGGGNLGDGRHVVQKCEKSAHSPPATRL